ncbi:hypothetical protein AA313_de0204177 [Arthrobotrys entomopaga]|nr:hypothetical protein AA313_de0204177 [Arthrobotrys entomopaga]
MSGIKKVTQSMEKELKDSPSLHSPFRTSTSVGFTIPMLSNRIHWFEYITDVKSLLDAFVRRNPILEPRRVSILLNGRRAPLYETIEPGTIVKGEYFPYQVDKFVSFKRNHGGKVKQAEKKYLDLKVSPMTQSTKMLVEATKPIKEVATVIQPSEPEEVEVRVTISSLGDYKPIFLAVIPTKIVQEITDFLRSHLMDIGIIQPGDDIYFTWPQLQQEPNWCNTMACVAKYINEPVDCVEMVVHKRISDCSAASSEAAIDTQMTNNKSVKMTFEEYLSLKFATIDTYIKQLQNESGDQMLIKGRIGSFSDDKVKEEEEPMEGTIGENKLQSVENEEIDLIMF